jgi:hypothetical protein
MKRSTSKRAGTAIAVLAILPLALHGAGPRTAAALEPKRAAGELIALTNIARTSNGLPALARDRRLDAVGEARSLDMITRNYFSHQIPPDNRTVTDVVEGLGLPFRAVGENIEFNNQLAFATVQYAQNEFMNSPSHRPNVLSPRWNRVGAGVAQGSDRRMYTVVFMQTAPATGQPARPGAVPAFDLPGVPDAPSALDASDAPEASDAMDQPSTVVPAAPRIRGERVQLPAARTGLVNSMVGGLLRLFLNI